MNLYKSKQSVSSFIKKLEHEDIAEKNAAALKNMTSTKLNRISQKSHWL